MKSIITGLLLIGSISSFANIHQSYSEILFDLKKSPGTIVTLVNVKNEGKTAEEMCDEVDSVISKIRTHKERSNTSVIPNFEIIYKECAQDMSTFELKIINY
ncbi:hypothetical protein HBN50_11070 [Halobacteriovorax sp. GB3]|uniref:hypothetical protein n=1 Tax=Halobacteriovorax sp. GB3 TaxID=2719615 RepID=UPI00235EBAED|nr:hypothetical protein [Halobacteriovorax sp. GB3]MDD0853644.1 hypothetical protein [Halobacteriovorax sp. GB3]